MSDPCLPLCIQLRKSCRWPTRLGHAKLHLFAQAFQRLALTKSTARKNLRLSIPGFHQHLPPKALPSLCQWAGGPGAILFSAAAAAAAAARLSAAAAAADRASTAASPPNDAGAPAAATGSKSVSLGVHACGERVSGGYLTKSALLRVHPICPDHARRSRRAATARQRLSRCAPAFGSCRTGTWA